MSDSARGLGPLYEGMQSGMDEVMGSWAERRQAPGFTAPWSSPPPMIGQFGENLLNSSFMEPFFEGMRDEMRRQLEQVGLLTEEAKGNWEGVFETQQAMLAEARKATEDIVALKNAPEERLRTQQVLNEMNLPEVIQERAMAFLDSLGLYGEEVQRQAVDVEVARRHQREDQTEEQANERVKEMLGSILRTLGVSRSVLARAEAEAPEVTGAPMSPAVEAAEEAKAERAAEIAERKKEEAEQRRASRPTSAGQHPFGDVVDTGAVRPGDLPDAGDFPEGGAPPGSRGGGGRRPDGLHPNAAKSDAKGPAERPGFALPTTWEEGMAFGANSDQWREAATGMISGRMDQWTSGWADRNRPDGFTDLQGKWHWADDAAGAAYEASLSRIGRVQGAVNAYGGGAGLSGALGRALPMAGAIAGGAGVALGAGALVTNTMEAQRDANRPYTSTYGRGETDAYGQRLQEWGFSNLEMLGTMDAKQAAGLYQDVAQTGLEGDDREAALDFAVANYRKFGMDVSQSMKFIEIAQRDGIDALDSYRQGLAAVAETAQESGNSIKEAQQAYADAIQATQGMTSGSASGRLATTLGGIETWRQDTAMADIDYARLLQSPAGLEQIAAITGQAYDDVAGAVVTGDFEGVTGAIAAADQEFIRLATHPTRVSEDSRRLMAQVRERSGNNPTTDEAIAVARSLMRDGVFEDRDIQGIAQQVFQQNVPKDALYELIAHNYLGSEMADVTQAGADIEERYNNHELDSSGLRFQKSMAADDRFKMWNERSGLLQEWGLEGEKSWWNKSLPNRTLDGAAPLYEATGGYFDDINKGRLDQRSQNLESVFDFVGDLAKDDPDAAREFVRNQFAVTDAEGKERRVTFDELPQHIEALESGRVHQVREDGSRVALQDVAGFDPTALLRERQQQVVKVEIEAKGPLADVLTVNQTGGADIERSRADGRPASPFIPRVPGGLFGGN